VTRLLSSRLYLAVQKFTSFGNPVTPPSATHAVLRAQLVAAQGLAICHALAVALHGLSLALPLGQTRGNPPSPPRGNLPPSSSGPVPVRAWASRRL
jgi:hypothetical protein